MTFLSSWCTFHPDPTLWEGGPIDRLGRVRMEALEMFVKKSKKRVVERVIPLYKSSVHTSLMVLLFMLHLLVLNLSTIRHSL